jgi:hypothetical protein
MEPTNKIYGLKNPITNEFFYVGLTGQELLMRLGGHMSSTDKNKDKVSIISKIKSAGKRPEIVLLEEIPFTLMELSQIREVEWMKKLIKEGHPIVNKAIHKAGRKPAENPKILINFWIEQKYIDKVGGMDAAIEICLLSIKSYAKELSKEMYTD